MAVKHHKTKTYPYSKEAFFAVLNDSRFCKMFESELSEEAKTADGIEFRFVKKTNVAKHGRNYNITVTDGESGSTKVTVTTQSRKVTVLWDPLWEKEVDHIFSILETFIELKQE